jgi:hypothetical protein
MSEQGTPATSELLRAVSEDVSRLVRRELDRFQDELRAQGVRAGAGLGMLAGAAVLGGLSVGSSGVFAIRVLDRWLPPRLAAFLATALYGAGAGALAVTGVRELKRTLPSPSEAADTVREGIDAGQTYTGPTVGETGGGI